MHKILLFIFLLFGSISAQTQRNLLDSIVYSPHLSFSYAYQFPQADLENRFGDNSNIGFSFNIKDRKNWYYGLQGTVIFGSQVTEPGLLSNLLTDNGEILDNFGQVSEIIVSQRGYTLTLEGGKIFPVLGPNPNCGILLKGGVGFMQHKIRIEHQINEITQLEDEYLKGYDRLTNGLVVSQFLGYYHMSNNRLMNFYVGAEAFEGFTQSRRDFNFDTQTVDDEARMDVLIGMRIGWIINLYQRESKNILLR